MVLKLYGSFPSTSVALVVIVLHEKQVPFELHPVDFKKGEHKSPEYIEKQPFGQIPCIDDDGFILYESRAICHYIATKYVDQGTKLIPTELKANALFHQACSIEVSNFAAPAGNAFNELVVKPYKGLMTDKAVADANMAILDQKLDVYDKILSKQKYLAGDEITLADLYHIPLGYNFWRVGPNPLEDEKRPNVVRWWKDITSRPSCQSLKESSKSAV